MLFLLLGLENCQTANFSTQCSINSGISLKHCQKWLEQGFSVLMNFVLIARLVKPLYFYCLEISITMHVLCNLFNSSLITTARLPCSLVSISCFLFYVPSFDFPFSLSCLLILAFPNLTNHLFSSNLFSLLLKQYLIIINNMISEN